MYWGGFSPLVGFSAAVGRDNLRNLGGFGRFSSAIGGLH